MLPAFAQSDGKEQSERTAGRRALVLGGGELGDAARVRAHLAHIAFDLVICADSGLEHAAPLGVVPTHIVGDFDSLPDGWERLAGAAAVHRFPADKDYTDMELAVDLAIKEGATDLVIAGATGGRLDHMLGNIMLLPRLAAAGLAARLIDSWNEAWIAPPVCRFRAEAGQIVSLLPLDRAVYGVTVRGLRYELTDATVTWGSTLTVSNEGVGAEAEITHREGALLIVVAHADRKQVGQ